MKPFIPLLFLTLLIGACSSLVDKGDKLFEAGEYEQAAQFYQRALRKNPDNVEATIGLKRAQEKIIDRGLIDVRMLRLGNNMESAVQKLEQLLRNQKTWGLQAAGAVALTQDEETRFARSWLVKEGARLAEGAFPDQYRYFKNEYASLIGGSVSLKRKLAEHDKPVLAKGRARCKKLAANVSGQRFFLKDFSRKYCAMWETPVSLNLDPIDTTRFSSLSLDNRVRYSLEYNSGYSGGFNSTIGQLSEDFRSSVWHSEKSQDILRVNARGRVEYNRRSRDVQRYVNYIKSSKTKFKDHEGKEVVATKEEEKVHRYRARVYNEEFSIALTLQSSVRGKALSRNISFQDGHQTESHGENFPPAYLQPQSPVFMDLPYIFNAEANALRNNFISALSLQWENKYCENMGDDYGESILRCAEVNAEHSYVNNWFESKFGLDYHQLSSLVGL